jgi:aminoglycoside phosphotransferase (APT) family kinase protein
MMDPFMDILRRDGVVSSADATLIPLTGGVSSEIYRVEDGPRTFVVKRALEKLRVEADWRADVSRNRFERMYLERVAAIVPGAFPEVLSAHDGYFTMEWLGGDWENWKSRLLAGDCRLEDASAAGRILGKIHGATAADPVLLEEFDTTPNFIQLRLDPYLMELARKYPEHRSHIETEIDRIATTRECLVHGDYSPKNMLLLSYWTAKSPGMAIPHLISPFSSIISCSKPSITLHRKRAFSPCFPQRATPI